MAGALGRRDQELVAQQEARDAGQRAGQRQRQRDVAARPGMPTARAMWRSEATARMRRPTCVRSSRNHRAATSTPPTSTIASGCRPSGKPAIVTAPLPRNGGAVRGAAPIVNGQALLDHRREREGGDEGRLGRPSRQRQDRDMRGEHAGRGQRRARPAATAGCPASRAIRPSSTATAPPSTTRSPCAKLTAPAALSASTKPSATSA